MNDSKVQNTSSKVNIKIKRLKELLSYDPNTGLFEWKVDRLNGKIKGGDVAGCKNNIGYIQIRSEGEQYLASRLAFLFMEGYLPEHTVDHINRIRDDNRWCNLRHTTMQCNNRNKSLDKRSTSGVSGVTWDKTRNQWRSWIRGDIKGKTVFLGRFALLKDAVMARWKAEIKYGYPGCNSESSAFLFLQNQK